MHDPHENQFVPVPDSPTPAQRDWTRFEEGEIVTLKGLALRVDEIGETRLVLKLIPQPVK